MSLYAESGNLVGNDEKIFVDEAQGITDAVLPFAHGEQADGPPRGSKSRRHARLAITARWLAPSDHGDGQVTPLSCITYASTSAICCWVRRFWSPQGIIATDGLSPAGCEPCWMKRSISRANAAGSPLAVALKPGSIGLREVPSHPRSPRSGHHPCLPDRGIPHSFG